MEWMKVAAGGLAVVFFCQISGPSPGEGKAREQGATDTGYLLGKFFPERDPGFVRIPTSHASREGMYLRKECHGAFMKMARAAEKEGIRLVILSATRTFHHQKWIWERKWTGKTPVEGRNLAREIPDPVARAREILRYSAMPGTSRHHWGTDVDVNSLEPAYFATPEGRRVYRWLRDHASRYGFCQVYTPKRPGRERGYEEEPWHWSYLPLAGPMLKAYLKRIDYRHIRGFLGDETAPLLQVIDRYVASVDSGCRW